MLGGEGGGCGMAWVEEGEGGGAGMLACGVGVEGRDEGRGNVLRL